MPPELQTRGAGRRIAGMLCCFSLVTACQSHLEGIPRPLQPAAKIRMKECKGWSDPLRPSRDRSAGFSILGYGLNMRDAEFRNTGAQNQYLIGIRLFIDACEKWARFESTDQEYREAKAALSHVAESTMTPQAFQSALVELKAGFAQALSEQETSTFKTQTEGESLPEPSRRQGTEQTADLPARLAQIDSRLANLETRLPNPLTSSRSTLVRFDLGSTIADPQPLREALGAVSAFTQTCPQARILLVGYTDRSGSPTANLALGLRRARAVRENLIGQGIAPGSIAALSGGATVQFGLEASNNRVVEVDLRCSPP
ncbi:OmpA family protein [Sphingobium sp. Cam5-1]|uniref:OmpA family protein n=1 Tax=Sphingobium sp. Cam5-1 TaxID=2789327 RepID=UPI0018AD1572|nr:OmpA family protein [Sphingobium sp. Cam5-1]QPI75454.1 OmpA family protein [Sphingobium sp. Cam5-1]